jgi:hypothetical protein
MKIENDVLINGKLFVSDIQSSNSSLSVLVEASGQVRKRNVGTMALQDLNDYIPEFSAALPSIFTIANPTINYSQQSLSVSLANQPANTVFAGPNNFGGTPSFRLLLHEDLPNLSGYLSAEGTVSSTDSILSAIQKIDANSKTLAWAAVTATPTTLAGYGITDGAASGDYLALSGGTLTGALEGTSATFSSSVTAKNGIFTNSVAGVTALRVVGLAGSLLIDNVGSGNNYFDATTSHEFQIGGTNKFRIDNSGAATFASSVTANGGFRSSGDSFTQNAGGLFFNGVGNFGSGILSDTAGTALKLQSGGGVALLLGADRSATFASSVTTGGVLKVNNNSNKYQGTVIFGSASSRNYRITSGDDNGSMVFESASLYGNSAYSFLGGAATFSSSVTATEFLAGLSGQTTFIGSVQTGNIMQIGGSQELRLQTYDNGWKDRLTFVNNGAATFASSVTAGSGVNIKGLSNSSNGNFLENGTDENGYYTNAINRNDGNYNKPYFIDAQKLIINAGSDGNLLIGSTQDNGSKLQVNGSATFSSSVTANNEFLLKSNATGAGKYSFQSPTSNWGPINSNISFTSNDGLNGSTDFRVNLWRGTPGDGYGASATKLLITSNGAATFSSSVTAADVNSRINFTSDTWHTSSDGVQRFNFVPNSDSYFKSGNNWIFRNSSNINVATIFSNGAATFASSVTADGGQTVVLNGSNGSVTFGANQGGGGVIKYNSNGNLDIIPRSGYSTTFASSIIIAGDISGNGSATLKTYWGGAYGGGFQIKTDGATVDRYSRFGMISNSKQWVGGMIINNDTSATFTDSVTATAFFGPSDMRLKTLVKKAHTNAVANISEISYLWKDESMGKRIQVGYDASVVKEHMPNAVNTDAKGMLSVNYIQVLVAKVAALEEQVKKLQNGI